MEILIAVLIGLFVVTGLYKAIPHRELGSKKPLIAILPKYKNSISTNLSGSQIEEKLASFGFKKKRSKGNISLFTRGSLLGDFSIKLIKINVRIRQIGEGKIEYTAEAAWVVAFDTGDHWLFANELGERLKAV